MYLVVTHKPDQFGLQPLPTRIRCSDNKELQKKALEWVKKPGVAGVTAAYDDEGLAAGMSGQ